MNAIIVCGGLSTRLGEITKSVPKILLEIKGRTVLDWQLKKLATLGIAEVVLAAGHLSETLQMMAGGERQGIKLVYAVEPERLGTGGAIKFALQFVKNKAEPTVILNGDILAGVDLVEMVSALKTDSDGLILGSYVEDAASYGTLAVDEKNKLLQFKEKEGLHEPGFINGGFYIFYPRLQQYFPDKAVFSIEYDVFPRVKNLYVYQSRAPWIDIGVPERLEWARQNWV